MSNRPIIKRKSGGYASNEGNGMVGGSWANCNHLFYKTCDIDGIVEDDAAYGWFYAKLDGKTAITFEAYFNEGHDNSVGISHYCDMDESFVPEDFLALLEACPLLGEGSKDEIRKKVHLIAVDPEGYEPYESDEPDLNDRDER